MDEARTSCMNVSSSVSSRTRDPWRADLQSGNPSGACVTSLYYLHPVCHVKNPENIFYDCLHPLRLIAALKTQIIRHWKYWGVFQVRSWYCRLFSNVNHKFTLNLINQILKMQINQLIFKIRMIRSYFSVPEKKTLLCEVLASENSYSIGIRMLSRVRISQ